MDRPSLRHQQKQASKWEKEKKKKNDILCFSPEKKLGGRI